jgi:GST-like protein
MPYKLYLHPRSGGAIVEAALAEIGAVYETELVDLRQGAQRGPAYLAVNPHGKVPALVTPEGETLTETLAILLSLDDRHPEGGLLPPRATPEREHALRWLAFAATELYPIVETLDYPERFAPTPESADATRAVAVEIWRSPLLRMEAQLAAGPYLLGERFCLTDVYWAVVSRWGHQQDWRPTHTPKLETLFATVAARPAIASAWGDRWD